MGFNMHGGVTPLKKGDKFTLTDSNGHTHIKKIKTVTDNGYIFEDGSVYTQPNLRGLKFNWETKEKKGGKRRKTNKSKRNSRRKTHRRR